MSFNYAKLKDESLASGDGTKNTTQFPVAKTRRSPVPSSRRFGTRSLSNGPNKVKIEKAMQELSSSVIRKKALTLTEITPSQKNRIQEQSLAKPLSAVQKQYWAGRRVYEALLLHSWRKQKQHVNNLTETLRSLETRNRKLDLQIEALHHLRIAESEKRNEAVFQTQAISRENGATIHRNKALQKENELLEDEVNVYREKLRVIQMEYETTRNDLMGKHIDLENSDYQLSLEKRKVKRLFTDKKSMEEQVLLLKKEMLEYTNLFEELQDKLMIAKSNLHDSTVSNNNFKKENKELLKQLDVEVSTTRNLLESHEKLKFSLFVVRRILRKERNRPWWRSARELGFVFLSSLKELAIILLPIMPEKDVF